MGPEREIRGRALRKRERGGVRERERDLLIYLQRILAGYSSWVRRERLHLILLVTAAIPTIEWGHVKFIYMIIYISLTPNFSLMRITWAPIMLIFGLVILHQVLNVSKIYHEIISTQKTTTYWPTQAKFHSRKDPIVLVMDSNPQAIRGYPTTTQSASD